jgi:hypothetical protein
MIFSAELYCATLAYHIPHTLGLGLSAGIYSGNFSSNISPSRSLNGAAWRKNFGHKFYNLPPA